MCLKRNEKRIDLGHFKGIPYNRLMNLSSWKPSVKTITCALCLGTLAVSASVGVGVGVGEEEKKKTRDEMVLDDRDALADNAHWIYNDLDRGFAEAERSGRPLMVVHRCIP